MPSTGKNAIRQQILAARARLSPQERQVKSESVGRRLFDLPEFCKSRTVLFFVGFGTEVSTISMIERAVEQGKTVVAPRVCEDSDHLELRQVSNPAKELSEGAMGILEPKRACPEVPLGRIDLIIVPAVAWDSEGYRVGYGGGFYDRLLARNENGITVGLGFECQIVQQVPRAQHDLGVDMLITEERVLRFDRGEAGHVR